MYMPIYMPIYIPICIPIYMTICSLHMSTTHALSCVHTACVRACAHVCKCHMVHMHRRPGSTRMVPPQQGFEVGFVCV